MENDPAFEDLDTDRYPGRAGYVTDRAVEKYARRSEGRDRSESRLLHTLLDAMPPPPDGSGRTALDAPSGTGRMGMHLRSHGFSVTGLDISMAMLLHERRGRVDRSCVAGAMEELPFRDEAFDLVLCWRFFHHLPSRRLRQDVLAELARVSRAWVILSFFHPLSMHNLRRRWKALFAARKGTRFTCTRGSLEGIARAVGLQPLRWIAQPPFLRDLHAVLLYKTGTTDTVSHLPGHDGSIREGEVPDGPKAYNARAGGDCMKG